MINCQSLCSRGLELVLNKGLPSLLAFPGEASLMVLPGDGMFQAQRIVNGKCRPVILHGHGGAKKEMPGKIWMDPHGSGNGRISSFVDWS